MRRAVTATVGTAVGLAALLAYKSSGPANFQRVSFGGSGTSSAPTAPHSSTSSSAGSASAPTTALPSTAGAPTTTATKTYDGQLVQYFYGDIQVSVTVQGGKVVNVAVPENGAADARSQMINSYAVPILEKEAVAAQGLNFNAVSGATFTSDAFAQSLQSALQKAGK